MKKATIMMSMLLALGLSSACSNDDDLSVLVDNKLALFEDSLQSLPENDYTGYLRYELSHGWYIRQSKPIDQVDTYYPLNLPEEFNEEGIKLSFSGRVVEMTDEERESLHFLLLGGHSYYFVYLTKIEKAE